MMAGPAMDATPGIGRAAPRDPVLAISGLSKRFSARSMARVPLKRLIRHPRQSLNPPRVEVLREISFEVGRGEFFAIVGSNGSGKSTLLRCIAGIYEPDAGEILASSRIAPFIELGASFHPDLDARDNIALVGTLIGLEPREARRRTPEILEYAELREFGGMPLRNFSSGMEARLAFAISLASDAELLLFDEVLAVSDLAFRERSFDAFERLRSEGRAVIYVSHQLETVSRFADRAMLLEGGGALRIGAPDAVLEEYEQRSRVGLTHPTLRLPDEGGAVRDEPAAGGPASGRRRDFAPAGEEDPPRAAARRFLRAGRALTLAELRVRYLDSVLGYLWALVQPLLMFAVLYFVFSKVVRFEEASHYPVQLLIGVVIFNYFAEATGLGLPSLVVRANLLQRIAFPAAAVPTASVVVSALSFVIGLGIAVAFAALSGVTISARWLELLPLAAVLVAFSAGTALILAQLFATARDVRPIWAVLTRVLFFATPVFYPIGVAPENLGQAIMMNPIAVVIVESRNALGLGGSSTAEAIGGAGWLAIPALLTIAVPCLGVWLYRARRNLVERL